MLFDPLSELITILNARVAPVMEKKLTQSKIFSHEKPELTEKFSNERNVQERGGMDFAKV